MSFLLDLLAQLGAGQQLIVAVTLGAVAFYLVRGKRLAGSVAVMAGSAVIYGIVVLVVLAVAIGLGWLNPRPGLFVDGIVSVGSAVVDVAKAPFEWLLKRLLEALQ